MVNLDWRKREASARMKKEAAAAAVAYGPPHCPDIFGTQGSVSSPTSLSPSSPVTFQEGHGYMLLSRFSLSSSSGEYPDGDPHGGFNPNSFFAPPDPHRDCFNTDLNAFLSGGINLNGASPIHHAGQGRLSPSSSSYFGVAGQDACSTFGGIGGEDAMHDIINTGSTADSAYTQEDDEAVIKEKEEEAVEEGGE
jgi:hypothetical protein